MRTCSDSSYKRRWQTGRPCFPGQIGRCGGPCSMKVTIEEHRAIVDRLRRVHGQPRPPVITRLTREMKRRRGRMRLRGGRDATATASPRSRPCSRRAPSCSRDGVDTDLFGIAHDELAAAVQQFIVRGGRIRGVRSWVVDKELDVAAGELVESGAPERLRDTTPPPHEIIVPALPDDAAALETLAGRACGRAAEASRCAPRSAATRRAARRRATLNAKQALVLYKTRRSADFVARSQALTDIQDALGLDEAPLRMECYDVSHLGGTNIVASMVVFEDGLPRKRPVPQVRHPGVRPTTPRRSTRCSRRRLAHLEDDDARPTGRRPTRSGDRASASGSPTGRSCSSSTAASRRSQAAQRALDDAGVTDIPLCGLAKRLEEIWLPGADFPVILPRNSEALFLLQRIRDEAHRFAITFQRQKRKHRHRVGARRDPRARPGAGEGAAQALRIGRAPQAARRRRDRRGAGASARLWPQRSSLGWAADRAAQADRRASEQSSSDDDDARTRLRARCSSSPACPAPAARPSATPSKTSAGTSSTTCRRRCCKPLVDLAGHAGDALPKVAAVVDVRGGKLFADVLEAPRGSCAARRRCACCSWMPPTPTLVRRFEQVRRPHPLQGDGTLLDGITRGARAHGRAARVQRLRHRHLRPQHPPARDRRRTRCSPRRTRPRRRVTVMSFGFKYGLPADADLVADCRFLPEPVLDPGAERRTPASTSRCATTCSRSRAPSEFIDAYVAALEPVLAGYQRENKRHATIAIGCTGGKHRSVAIAEELATPAERASRACRQRQAPRPRSRVSAPAVRSRAARREKSEGARVALTADVKEELAQRRGRQDDGARRRTRGPAALLRRPAHHLGPHRGRGRARLAADSHAACAKTSPSSTASAARCSVISGSNLRAHQHYLVRVIDGGETLARQTGLLDARRRPVRGLPNRLTTGSREELAAVWRGAFLAARLAHRPRPLGRPRGQLPRQRGRHGSRRCRRPSQDLGEGARGARRAPRRHPRRRRDRARCSRSWAPTQSVTAWEELRQRREVRATANRLVNFDDANLRRSRAGRRRRLRPRRARARDPRRRCPRPPAVRGGAAAALTATRASTNWVTTPTRP